MTLYLSRFEPSTEDGVFGLLWVREQGRSRTAPTGNPAANPAANPSGSSGHDGEPYGFCGVMPLQTSANVPWLATLELPWRDNLPNVSCTLPAPGDLEVYTLRYQWSPDWDRMLWEDVRPRHGRNEVKFHILNRREDSLGCRGVGTRFGNAKRPATAKHPADKAPRHGILGSTTALSRLHAWLKPAAEADEAVQLVIGWGLLPGAPEAGVKHAKEVLGAWFPEMDVTKPLSIPRM